MKIAHVSAHYRPVIGGQEVYISNLIDVCRRHGHDSKVFQLNRGQQADDTVCLPRLRYLARLIPGFDRRSLNYMIDWLKPKELFNSDAIIAHYAFHAPPLERVRKKTIILSHGVEWRTIEQGPFDEKCEANAIRCLDRFTHVVNDTHYLRYLGLDVPAASGYFSEVASGKWFIPNCVDTEHFAPGPGLQEYLGKKMILVPRQMVADRGIHLAIEAFAHIADDFPDFEMCLLGKRHSGSTKYLRRLDELIREFDLDTRVYFRDPVPNAMMPAWYNSATATVIPTVAREGTSLSALESMSCGVATISTNVAGLADLPTIQCDPDGESIAIALKETLNNASTIGSQQREEVKSLFNLENWSRAWIRVITTVAG